MRVIGGAGGTLNILKLKGVKSEVHYKQEAAERSATARQKRKDQIASDKELGIHEAKQKARAEVEVQRRKAQDSFIAQVAESLGWEPAALKRERREFHHGQPKRETVHTVPSVGSDQARNRLGRIRTYSLLSASRPHLSRSTSMLLILKADVRLHRGSRQLVETGLSAFRRPVGAGALS